MKLTSKYQRLNNQWTVDLTSIIKITFKNTTSSVINRAVKYTYPKLSYGNVYNLLAYKSSIGTEFENLNLSGGLPTLLFKISKFKITTSTDLSTC